MASASHVVPSLAELGRMAATSHYAPIYREVLADVETPVSALLKLGAGPGSFLLESVEGGEFVGSIYHWHTCSWSIRCWSSTICGARSRR